MSFIARLLGISCIVLLLLSTQSEAFERMPPVMLLASHDAHAEDCPKLVPVVSSLIRAAYERWNSDNLP